MKRPNAENVLLGRLLIGRFALLGVHRRRRGALAQLLMMNKRLFQTDLLKEQFEHAWTYTTARGMREFLVRWRRLLNWSRLQPLIRFWEMLWRHIDGVTAWLRTA